MTKKDTDGYVHVIFELSVDANGWPPVGSERVWSSKVGEGKYKIENTPFYIRGISFGDIVAVSDRDGVLFFDKLLEDSGHRTVRVSMQKEELEQNLINFLREKGADIEALRKGFFAIDIPPNANFGAIMSHLREGEQDNKWAYEEGKV